MPELSSPPERRRSIESELRDTIDPAVSHILMGAAQPRLLDPQAQMVTIEQKQAATKLTKDKFNHIIAATDAIALESRQRSQIDDKVWNESFWNGIHVITAPDVDPELRRERRRAFSALSIDISDDRKDATSGLYVQAEEFRRKYAGYDTNDIGRFIDDVSQDCKGLDGKTTNLDKLRKRLDAIKPMLAIFDETMDVAFLIDAIAKAEGVVDQSVQVKAAAADLAEAEIAKPLHGSEARAMQKLCDKLGPSAQTQSTTRTSRHSSRSGQRTQAPRTFYQDYNPTPNVSPPQPKRKGLSRKAAIATTAIITAGALAVGTAKVIENNAQAASSSTEQGNEKQEPSIDVAFGPLNATVEALKNNPSVDTDAVAVDLQNVHTLLTPRDYKRVRNSIYDEEGLNNGISMAKLLEITYDRETNTLQLEDNMEGQIDPNTMYHLLAPLVNEQMVRTAFASGLDTIRVYLNNPNAYDSGLVAGEYAMRDTVDGDKIQSMNLYLPKGAFTQYHYDLATRHEAIHAVTISPEENNDPRSEEGFATPEAYAEWQVICDGIRNIAVDQAEQQTDALIAIMNEKKVLFQDPLVSYKFQVVINALQAGKFNQFQSGLPEEYYKTDIPNCQVRGPYDAFKSLFTDEEWERLELALKAEEKLDDLKLLENSLVGKWGLLLAENTIYTTLREGTYTPLPNDEYNPYGHPQDNWDELTASITNLALSMPEVFGKNVAQLPPDQKQRVLTLVERTMQAMLANIPDTPDQDPARALLRAKYNIFIANVA